MTTSRSLTLRQQAIYDYLVERIQFQRFCPTVREICTHFGIRSPNGAVAHLRALEKKGLIDRAAGLARNIPLLRVPNQMFPVFDHPLNSTLESDRKRPNTSRNRRTKAPRFTLAQIQDDSLVKRHILPGDWLAFENRSGRQKPVALFRRFSNNDTFTLSMLANAPITYTSSLPPTRSTALVAANS